MIHERARVTHVRPYPRRVPFHRRRTTESHFQRSRFWGDAVTQGAAFVGGVRAPSVLNLRLPPACPGLGVSRAVGA